MKYAFDEFKEGMAIAFQAIRANKMRSVLTTLGIVIGIVSVTLMGTAIEGLNRAFNKSIASIGADVLYVQKWPWVVSDDWWKFMNRRDIRMQHEKALERNSETATAVAPVISASRTVKFGQKYIENVVVIGTGYNFLEIHGANIAFGRFFTRAEGDGGRPVCVIGSEVAANLFPNENPIGRTVKVGGYVYETIGVMEKQGSSLGSETPDNRVYLPITRFFQEFTSRWGGISINVKARSVDQLEDTKEEIRGIMRKARGLSPRQEDDFAINQQELLVQTFNQIGGVIAAVGLFITGLSLFVGGIGIMNIMFVSVTELYKGNWHPKSDRSTAQNDSNAVPFRGLCVMFTGRYYRHCHCFSAESYHRSGHADGYACQYGFHSNFYFSRGRSCFRIFAGLSRLASRSGRCITIRISWKPARLLTQSSRRNLRISSRVSVIQIGKRMLLEIISAAVIERAVYNHKDRSTAAP